MAQISYHIEMKNADGVDMAKSISKYIQKVYGAAEQQQFKAAAGQLSARREKVRDGISRGVLTIEQLRTYYTEVAQLEQHVPLSDTQCKILFKWSNPLSTSGHGCGQMSGGFERACLLYNLGALHAEMAKRSDLTMATGLKTAAGHYAQSAGCFERLRDVVMPTLGGELTKDMSAPSLSMMRSIALAEAQELFYMKAEGDGGSGALLSKLAGGLAELWGEAARSMRLAGVEKGMGEFGVYVSVRARWCVALSHTHLSEGLHKSMAFGEEIARLKLADREMTAAQAEAKKGLSRPGYDRVKMAHATINLKLAGLEEENNSLYMDHVPARVDPPGKAIPAKPAKVELEIAEHPDAWGGMLPVDLYADAELFAKRRNAMVDRVGTEAQKATNEARTFLLKSGLPSILDAIDSSVAVLPERLESRLRAVAEYGGLGKVQLRAQEMDEACDQRAAALDSCTSALNAEQAEDLKCAEEHGRAWPMKRSAKKAQPLRKSMGEVQDKLNQQRGVVNTLSAQIEAQKADLEHISMPIDSLRAQAPGPLTGADASNAKSVAKQAAVSKAVADLRASVAELEAILESREGILKKLHSDMGDSTIRDALLALDGDTGGAARKQIVEDELEKFGAVMETVSATVAAQVALLPTARAQFKSFDEVKPSDKGTATSRAAYFKQLEALFALFKGVQEKVNEGAAFLNEMTKFHSAMEEECVSYVNHRAEKREITLRKLGETAPHCYHFGGPAQPATVSDETNAGMHSGRSRQRSRQPTSVRARLKTAAGLASAGRTRGMTAAITESEVEAAADGGNYSAEHRGTWSWRSGDDWKPYNKVQDAKIEAGFLNCLETGEAAVEVSATHYVDFKSRRQVKMTDETRWRAVARMSLGPAQPRKAATPPPSSARMPEVPMPARWDAVAWSWQNKDQWKPYDAAVAAKIESAHALFATGDGLSSVEISSSHYVDLEKMRQVSMTNANRFRHIRREAPAAKPANFHQPEASPPSLPPASGSMKVAAPPAVKQQPVESPQIALGSGVWQWKAGHSFKPYSSDDNAKIEAAYSEFVTSGGSDRLSLGSYYVDFSHGPGNKRQCKTDAPSRWREISRGGGGGGGRGRAPTAQRAAPAAASQSPPPTATEAVTAPDFSETDHAHLPGGGGTQYGGAAGHLDAAPAPLPKWAVKESHSLRQLQRGDSQKFGNLEEAPPAPAHEEPPPPPPSAYAPPPAEYTAPPATYFQAQYPQYMQAPPPQGQPGQPGMPPPGYPQQAPMGYPPQQMYGQPPPGYAPQPMYYQQPPPGYPPQQYGQQPQQPPPGYPPQQYGQPPPGYPQQPPPGYGKQPPPQQPPQ